MRACSMENNMKQIQIVSLGTPDTITKTASEMLLRAERLFVQTDRHPSALPVMQSGRAYRSMDDIYETAADFDALNAEIAARLIAAAPCVYAVPGTPTPALLNALGAAFTEAGASWTVLPGVSLAEAAFPARQEGLTFTAAALPKSLDPSLSATVIEIDSRIRAGEVKLLLTEYYPDEHEVTLAKMDKLGRWRKRSLPLSELDHGTRFDATTTLYVPSVRLLERTRYSYADLLEILQILRAPGGCPWDREQTHSSLREALLEECYELLEAIGNEDDAGIEEELGDVLMQVAFHAMIAEEQRRFTSRDVSTGVVQKLIYRHPHVFGSAKAETAGDVLVNWEKLKKIEKHQQTQTDVLMAVPKNLPALVRSYKVQKKAANVGFDWDDAEAAFYKIGEETAELKEAMEEHTNVAEELGDLLFAVVNVARLQKQNPELALCSATEKFTRRFAAMEALASKRSLALENMTLSQMDALWDEVKKAPEMG